MNPELAADVIIAPVCPLSKSNGSAVSRLSTRAAQRLQESLLLMDPHDLSL